MCDTLQRYNSCLKHYSNAVCGGDVNRYGEGAGGLVFYAIGYAQIGCHCNSHTWSVHVPHSKATLTTSFDNGRVLERWLCEGVVSDPYGEFMVQEHKVALAICQPAFCVCILMSASQGMPHAC